MRGGLNRAEPLAQEDAEQRCVIGEMVAPCQPGQRYRLTLVVFEGWLMQIGVAILFMDAHFETDACEILLNRRKIGEQQVPGSCLVAEQWMLKQFQYISAIRHNGAIRHSFYFARVRHGMSS